MYVKAGRRRRYCASPASLFQAMVRSAILRDARYATLGHGCHFPLQTTSRPKTVDIRPGYTPMHVQVSCITCLTWKFTFVLEVNELRPERLPFLHAVLRYRGPVIKAIGRQDEAYS